MTQYYLTVDNGSGSGWYSPATHVTCYAQIPTGYHWTAWAVNAGYTDYGETITIIMPSYDATATAIYAIDVYHFTYSAGAGGSISGTTSQNVNYGGSTTAVTATPSAGYHFVSWSDSNTNATRSDYANGGNLNPSYTATFASNAPTVTSLATTSGPPAGGTSVVITGTYFTSATAVKFGTTDAASYTVDSATQITAVTPAHAEATVDVSVTTANGTGTKSSAFTFVMPTGSVAGTSTPTGAITTIAIGHKTLGSSTPTGSLSIVKTSAYAPSMYASVTPVGRLFTVTVRPITLHAPYVPTMLDVP